MQDKMENKDKQRVREVLNKWLKQQTRFINYDDKLGGYLITKSQIEKLKKKLWRLEECKEVVKGVEK